MELWNEPDDVYAPLVAAVPPGTEWAGFGNALIVAAEMVPVSDMPYNTKQPGRFRRTQTTRRRLVSTSVGKSAAPFSAKAWLIDEPLEETTGNAAYTYWKVGMTNVKDCLCVPAVPVSYDTAIFECTMLRLSHVGQPATVLLALLRHLWAAAVERSSPGAVVFGGQRRWDASWWKELVSQGTAPP